MTLPNFFLIGAQKCGTDALYDALSQHPQIFMSPEKEPAFFITEHGFPPFRSPSPGYRRRVVTDWDRYGRLFDGVRDEIAIGEASAIYLSSYFPDRTARRIHQHFPEARIIALLRQPAERAYAAFNFYSARGIEPLDDFELALREEKSRWINGECPDIRHRANGLYWANLQPYYDVFPPGNIQVHLFEDWNAKPHLVLRDIFKFLGVADDAQINVRRLNATRLYRSKWVGRAFINPSPQQHRILRLLPAALTSRIQRWNEQIPLPLSPALHRALTADYRDDILALQHLIGRDLSHWLTEPPVSSRSAEERS